MAARAGCARAILLDAMGTLIELRPPAPRLVRELSTRFGVRVGLAQAEQAISAEIAYYREHLDDGRDDATVAELRGRCAEVVSQSLSLSPALNRAQVTDALLAALQFRRYPDVVPALRAARERGLRLVVVSNWDASLSVVLERLDVLSLLDGVLTSAQVGVRKPNPEIFVHALAIAGVRAEYAIHVGDRLDEDVAGARAAGVEPVWLRRASDRLAAVEVAAPAGVTTIGSLAELGV